MTDRIPMRDLAKRINAHLVRFEGDPKINKPIKPGSELHPYYQASAWYPGGGYISISYVNYQGFSSVKRVVAEEYLRQLDEGYVGKHFKMTSRGEEYVPRGYTVDPCPGCGKDHKRKKDKVCDECSEKIEKWDAFKATQDKLGEEVPYKLNARAYALPSIPNDDRGMSHPNREDREPIRNRFFELSFLLSTPSEATWKDEPPSLWPHEQLKTWRNEYEIFRNMKPAVAKLLGELYFEVAVGMRKAHEKGVAEGKNLLLSLAGGHLTSDEFNTQAARLTGKKDEE